MIDPATFWTVWERICKRFNRQADRDMAMEYLAYLEAAGLETQEAHQAGLAIWAVNEFFPRPADFLSTQAALGWSAEIAKVRFESGRAEIEIYFKSVSATPISGLAVAGQLSRLVDDRQDRALAFDEVAPGLYRATLASLDGGAWRLEATATSASNESFQLAKRVTME